MKKVLAIIGPTASGKTKLSVEIATRLNGEIISADSRQIYKNISISTCQPSEDDIKKVKHYFVGEFELEEEFNAGEFGKKGRIITDEIISQKKLPVIAGGSGLYIRSLIDGFFNEEIKSKEVRMELYEKLRQNGKESLYNELKKVDERSAREMIPENIRRVVRALEVYYVSGKKISDLKKDNIEADFETVQVGLMFDREELYKRINKRVDEMILNGLLEEVRSLKEKGYDPDTHNSLNSVGIKEVFGYLKNEFGYNTMVELIKRNTRRYAKRQMTWFGKDKRISWLNVNEDTDMKILADNTVKLFKDS